MIHSMAGFLEEYGLGEKAPHAHTNYKLESSNFAVRVIEEVLPEPIGQVLLRFPNLNRR